MGMFEKDPIRTLKIGILLKWYTPYKLVSLSGYIYISSQIRHSMKDTNTPHAFLFLSPFFGSGWGCLSPQFHCWRCSPSTVLFLHNRCGKCTRMHLSPHCSWKSLIKNGQERGEKQRTT